jgi:zinc protease
LDRIKKMLMKSIERSYNERDKTESSHLVDEYIRNFLEQEPIPGIENEYKYYTKYLEEISLEEVNAYAANSIPTAQDPKLVILTGPDHADFQIPANDELLAMANQAAASEITAYEETAVAAAIMEEKPAPGSITETKEDKTLELTTILFANGTRVILKPTDFKNDQVVLNASRFGGQYLYDAKDRFNAEYASTVVSQMGIAGFSPLDLRKILAGKTASLSPRIGTISEGVSGQSSASDIETMLQLVYLYFTQPRKDDDLFKSFISKQQALYQNMAANPQFTFQDSLIAILYKDHPWAPKLPKPENFARIDQQRVLDIYKERFGNAHGFTFVLVGKFDIAEIKPLLATYIGSLPSSGQHESYKDVGLRPVKGSLKREIIKGTEPKSFIRMFWNGESPYSATEELKLQALSEVLNIKIIETLREDLAGIYGGGMYGNLTKYPYPHYSIGVSLPCGPENVDKLIQAALGEIDKIKKNGPSAEDLNKVKETWRQQHEEHLKDNGYWARQLLESVEMASDPKEVLRYEDRLSSLTPIDLKETANRYMKMDSYIQVVLNPEAQ